MFLSRLGFNSNEEGFDHPSEESASDEEEDDDVSVGSLSDIISRLNSAGIDAARLYSRDRFHLFPSEIPTRRLLPK